MSVTFDISGMKWPTDEDGCALPPGDAFVNLANANAREFFAWLGVDGGEYLCGSMRARELAAVAAERLGDPRAVAADTGTFGVVEGIMVSCGRPQGRFVAAAGRLLRLAELAGDLGVIHWS